MFKTYNEKLRLLIEVISFVAKQRCFAMHGGTAINLFVCDMPRLSVDIDLTYLPIEDRQTTLSNINEALRQIKDSVENKIPNNAISDCVSTREFTINCLLTKPDVNGKPISENEKTIMENAKIPCLLKAPDIRL